MTEQDKTELTTLTKEELEEEKLRQQILKLQQDQNNYKAKLETDTLTTVGDLLRLRFTLLRNELTSLRLTTEQCDALKSALETTMTDIKGILAEYLSGKKSIETIEADLLHKASVRQGEPHA